MSLKNYSNRLSIISEEAWKKTKIEIKSQKKNHKMNGEVYPIEVVKKTEPRIEYIYNLISSILQFGKFTQNGKIVEIDGFKLRSVDHWAEKANSQPDEILELLSTRCAVKCEFCYLRMDNNKSVTQFNLNHALDVQTDIDMRLSLLERGKRIFVPTFQLEEIMGHPYFRSAVIKLRSLHTGPIAISTTGSLLTEEMLDFLQEMQPLEIRVSLNAVSMSERIKLMHDKTGMVLNALKSMKKRYMRFSVSLVIWPSLSWNEIEETIRFASECMPYSIFVILPGYTDTFSKSEPFNTEAIWKDAVKRLTQLRHFIETPLIIHPRLYEEVSLNYPPNLPIVIGIISGSAAQKSGICLGDILFKINDVTLSSRRQAWNLIELLRVQDTKKVVLTILRNGIPFTCVLDVENEDENYPHRLPFADGYGLVLISQGVAISDLRELARIAEKRFAKNVAIATSEIVLPSLLALIDDWKSILFKDIEVFPFIPKNEFYGGNIVLGELNTVSDFLSAIEELAKNNPEIDLVCIPSPAFSPGGWWRDLEGVSFQRLVRASPLPIELLVCSQFE